MNNDFNAFVKEVNKINPKNVEGLNNSSYFYYFYKLYKLLSSVFTFDSLPDTWDESYLKDGFILHSPICVTDTEYGVIPLMSGYSGLNYFNQPTDFIISNPVIGNKQGKINEDGVMVYLDKWNGHYKSLDDVISRYAVLLSEIDGSLNTTLINSRVAHIFTAHSNAQLKKMEKVYDKISNGEPAVFIQNNTDENLDHAVFNNVKNTYIGNELLLTKRTIYNDFLSEIGINNSNTDKKERLITSESDSNMNELYANIYTWDTNLKTCFKKINEMYNIDVGYHLNSAIISTLKAGKLDV